MNCRIDRQLAAPVAGAWVVLFACAGWTSFAGQDFAPKDRGYRVGYPDRVAKANPLRGVMSPVIPKERDFKDLKAWGAKLVRYQMIPLAEKKPAADAPVAERLAFFDAAIAKNLDKLEKDILPWARKYGLKVVVDLHEAPGGRGKDGEVVMYHDAAVAAHFVEFWRTTAARFKGNHDVIYGYDLFNEPVQTRPGVPDCDYWTVQRRAAEAIRAVDPDTSVIVEANKWDLSEGFRQFPALEMDNVIYSVHVYDPHDFTHQGVQKQWPRGVKWPSADAKGVMRDRAWLDEKLRPVRQFAYNHRAKIYVGEFSAISWGEGAERYLADCIALFEQYGWDWTYHAFREWSGWSVEHEYRADAPGDGLVPAQDTPRMKVLKAGLGGQVDSALLTWSRDAAEQGRAVDEGWRACMEKCWSPKTSLVYNCAPSKVRPAKAFDDGPGYYRWQKDVKGKNHYGEGMGDCALICGTVLSGLVDRYLVTGDAETKAMAAKVARGVLNLAVLHGFKGFVARGICEEDGKSVCSLSSRDQYTHWLHGLLRYVESGMADAAFRKEFAAEAVHVAEYMERLCTPERNWNFGMVDGSPDPRGICTMWGPDLHPHEQARLPMIYGAAWRMSGDRHWKELYEKFIDEALEKSQGMAVAKETNIMPCYSLLQAMCSFEAILTYERDPSRVAKLRSAMAATAAVAANRARVELARPRTTFYGMCDDGELSLTMAMLPGGFDAALEREFLARTVARSPLAVAGTCRNAHVYAAYWRNRRADAGWRVKELNGAPALFRDGKPVPPVIFWQWDLQEEDVKAMSGAGMELFSMFGSFGHYEHPYWTEKGFGGLAYQEGNIDRLLEWNPEACFLPRIFSAAPDWWIEANPDEQVRYTNPGPVAGRFWAKARESFASEKCRAELSPVYRQAVRRLYGRYGRHLIGIHVTNGPWGENFAWDGYTQAGGTPLEQAGYSDSSAPMTRAFRAFLREKYEGDDRRLRAAWKDGAVTFDTAAVPAMAERFRLDATGVWRDPAAGRKVPDYFECMNRVTVGLVDHYAGIVKDETQGRLATLAFYGYTQDEHWTLECDHRAISRMYRSPNVDMFSAPHTYHRRSPGEDGEMRCYLASAALHGKLFVDESDDRTHLELAKPHPDARCSATNMYESLNLLYRAFGNAVTHGVGLWYMDLARDSFRAPELVDAVGRMRRAAAESLRHDRSHVSEVAVVSNVESEFYMGYRRTEANNVNLLLYLQQMGAFYRCGAPFDWYLAEDLDAVVRRGYKVVVLLDCQYLTERQRAQVEELKRDGRTLVTFHAPGYVSETGLSRERMEGVCGVRMRPETFRGVLSAVDAATGAEWGCGLDRVIDGVGDRPRGVRHRTPGTAQKGLFLPAAGADVRTLMTGVGELKGVPVAVARNHGNWTGVFSALPALAPDVLRRIYREAGVHLYTERDVVLSANSAWLMLHTREAGEYPVTLKRKARKVTDVTCGKVVAENADRFTYPLEKFQTAVFLFE